MSRALQPPIDNGCRLSRRSVFGLFPVRSPLPGSRGFFPFLGLLRCFSSPACRSVPMASTEYARITTRGFPHSEIPGSKVGQHLPRAYRSRPRPSSAPGAKASTVCPCSLDQKRTRVDVAMEFSRCARDASSVTGVSLSPPAHSGRSLKTQQREIVEVDVVLGELHRTSGQTEVSPHRRAQRLPE